jgi:hypothetical protein
LPFYLSLARERENKRIQILLEEEELLRCDAAIRGHPSPTAEEAGKRRREAKAAAL